MKRLGLFIFTLVISLLLISCATSNEFRLHTQQDLLKETWITQINTNPTVWMKGTDPWFFTDEPRNLSQYAIKAPIDNSISHMMVRVPRFTGINIDGDFRVQIMGHQERNSVEIIGSNESVRQISVTTVNHTLNLRQIRNPDPKAPQKPNDAIIRIGINNLRSLTDCGNGMVTGKGIFSDGLVVNSICNAKILLKGNMNLRQVTQSGSGSVTLIGAYAPNVDVKATDNATVNISGRVGVQSISSFGNSHINIIGADTNRLVIRSGQMSIVKVVGYANVKSIIATEGSCVSLYYVNSNGLRVSASDAACISLAGCVTNLQVNLTGSSRFWGQYLKANSAYVTTADQSHANISATHQVFASASGISSIYYTGSPSKISRFTTDKGAIIAVWTNEIPTPTVTPQLTTWNYRQQRSY